MGSQLSKRNQLQPKRRGTTHQATAIASREIRSTPKKRSRSVAHAIIIAAERNLDKRLRWKGGVVPHKTPEEVNKTMAKKFCNCKLPDTVGTYQCQFGCECDGFRKTCGINCVCQGLCSFNSFVNIPRTAIRKGVIGEELFTKEDIHIGRLSYVFTGQLSPIEQYKEESHAAEPKVYAISAKWPGAGAGLPGKRGKPSFVINAENELVGRVNHSCDPNTEVYEMSASNVSPNLTTISFTGS